MFSSLIPNYSARPHLGLTGNVKDDWPKLFQALSVKFTINFFHACIHSISPHKHVKIMHLIGLLMQNCDF